MDKNLGILLLLDVPQGSEIGLDMKHWITPEKFYGIRNIPAGFHILYTRSGRDNSMSGLRISYPLNFASNDVIKLQYCCETEQFLNCYLSSDEVERIKQNDELPQLLPAYPKDLQKTWLSLSCFISYEAVKKFLPGSSQIYSCDFLQSIPSNSNDRLAANYQIPVMKEIEEYKLNFTKMPKYSNSQTSHSLRDVTTCNMDKTEILNEYLKSLDAKARLVDKMSRKFELEPQDVVFLSELQFSFIVVLICQNMSGWYHWRDILSVLSNCENKIRTSPQLFRYIIFVLYYQMLCDDPVESIDYQSDTLFSLMADAFSDENTKENIISISLRKVFSNIFNTVEDMKLDEISEPVKAEMTMLSTWSEGFRSYLEQRYKWDLSFHRNIVCQADANGDLSEIPVDSIDWDTEDAPVIVTDTL